MPRKHFDMLELLFINGIFPHSWACPHQLWKENTNLKSDNRKHKFYSCLFRKFQGVLAKDTHIPIFQRVQPTFVLVFEVSAGQATLAVWKHNSEIRGSVCKSLHCHQSWAFWELVRTNEYLGALKERSRHTKVGGSLYNFTWSRIYMFSKLFSV